MQRGQSQRSHQDKEQEQHQQAVGGALLRRRCHRRLCHLQLLVLRRIGGNRILFKSFSRGNFTSTISGCGEDRGEDITSAGSVGTAGYQREGSPEFGSANRRQSRREEQRGHQRTLQSEQSGQKLCSASDRPPPQRSQLQRKQQRRFQIGRIPPD